MKDCIRHGDVFFRPAKELPKESAEDERNHYSSTVHKQIRKSPVILTGEVTGHAHRMIEGEYEILDYYEKTWRNENPVLSQTFINVKTPSIVSHEEHGPLPVLPGLYEIVRAREFNYADGLRAARYVND